VEASICPCPEGTTCRGGLSLLRPKSLQPAQIPWPPTIDPADQLLQGFDFLLDPRLRKGVVILWGEARGQQQQR